MSEDENAAGGTAMPGAGDPEGRAGLLLVEALIHKLLARSIIDIADAIDILDTATSVHNDLIDEAGVQSHPADALLSRIARSLMIDRPPLHVITPGES